MARGNRRIRTEQTLNQHYQSGRGGARRQRPVKRRILHALRITSALVVLIALLIGAGWLFFSYRVEEIKVVNADQPDQVRQVVRDYLRTHSHNLALINSGDMAQSLVRQYQTTYADVTVTKLWSQRALEVEMAARVPTLRWETRSQTYVMDALGVIMRQTGAEADKKLPRVRDTSSLPVEVGQKVAPTQFVTFVDKAINQLREMAQLRTREIRVEDTTAEAFFDTHKGFYVRFDTTGSVEEQVSNVVSILETADQKDQPVNEYIDVRIPHKAYYR